MENLNFKDINLIKNRDYFDKFDSLLTCPICLDFLINPHTCDTCQKSCCRECLSTWDKNKEGNPFCPSHCPKPIFTDKNIGIRNLLAALKIKCVRCAIEVNYEDLLKHVKETCGKIEVNCSNYGCSKKINKEELSNHFKNCEFQIKDCEQCGKPTIDKFSNKVIEKLRNESSELKMRVQNISQTNDTILKEKQELAKENQNVVKENEKLEKEKEKWEKEKEELKSVAYEVINDNFTGINKLVNNKGNKILLDQLNERMKKIGAFLSSDQIKKFYEYLLNYHFKESDSNNIISALNLLGTLLETNRESMKSNKTLSEELLNKFLNIYSLDNISEYDLDKELLFLNTIISYLGKYIPWSSDNISLIVKTNIKYLELNNSIVRDCSSNILGKMAIDCPKEFNVHLLDILNSLSNAINYKEDDQDKEEWKSARDWATWALGATIYMRHEHINAYEWIPKWLSYFPLESGIKQEYSYDILCIFNEEEPEILYGKKNENLPSIIKILIKMYKDDNFKLTNQDSQNRINSFFEKIKNDSKLRKFVRTAKATSEGRTLQKLNEHFP